MKPSTLAILEKKHPHLTKQQISFIVKFHIGNIGNRVTRNTTFSITVPKLGRIHTHGNAKNKAYSLRIKKFTKRWRHLNKFTDTELLF